MLDWIRSQLKERQWRREGVGGEESGGEAAVERQEVFNWRVTLGARLVSSSPSITRSGDAWGDASCSLLPPSSPSPLHLRHSTPLIRALWPTLTWRNTYLFARDTFAAATTTTATTTWWLFFFFSFFAPKTNKERCRFSTGSSCHAGEIWSKKLIFFPSLSW